MASPSGGRGRGRGDDATLLPRGFERTLPWWRHAYLGVRQSRGGGRCVFTRRAIRAGQLIMIERPATRNLVDLTVVEQIARDPRFLQHHHDDHKATASSSSAAGAAADEVVRDGDVMSLARARRVFALNSWSNGDIFLHISMTNHCCAPNAANHSGVVFALRDLAPGDELTFSYLPTDELQCSRARRRHRLSFWFDACCCSVCAEPAAATTAGGGPAAARYQEPDMEALHARTDGARKLFAARYKHASFEHEYLGTKRRRNKPARSSSSSSVGGGGGGGADTDATAAAVGVTRNPHSLAKMRHQWGRRTRRMARRAWSTRGARAAKASAADDEAFVMPARVYF